MFKKYAASWLRRKLVALTPSADAALMLTFAPFGLRGTSRFGVLAAPLLGLRFHDQTALGRCPGLISAWAHKRLSSTTARNVCVQIPKGTFAAANLDDHFWPIPADGDSANPMSAMGHYVTFQPVSLNGRFLALTILIRRKSGHADERKLSPVPLHSDPKR